MHLNFFYYDYKKIQKVLFIEIKLLRVQTSKGFYRFRNPPFPTMQIWKWRVGKFVTMPNYKRFCTETSFLQLHII